MKLLINMSEDDYKEVKKDTYSGTPFENRVFSAVANGTPLPKGHGRLIDADALKKDDEVTEWLSLNAVRTGKMLKRFSELFIKKIDATPSIIEADTESEDKQTEKSCDNCAMQYSCVGLIYGNYWCWKPKESEE